MGKIHYKLRSKESTIVVVPREYAEFADRVVQSAISGIELEDPRSAKIFGNIGIVSRYNSLKESPNDLKLQDDVYLRVCVSLNERNIDMESRKIDCGLTEAVRSL